MKNAPPTRAHYARARVTHVLVEVVGDREDRDGLDRGSTRRGKEIHYGHETVRVRTDPLWQGKPIRPLHRRLPRPQPTRDRTPSARSVIILLGRPAVSNAGEVGRPRQTIPRPRACPGAKRAHSGVLVRGESSGGNPRRGSFEPGWRPGRAAFHSESKWHGSSGT